MKRLLSVLVATLAALAAVAVRPQGVPPAQLPRLIVADPVTGLLIIQQGTTVYSITLSNLITSASSGMEIGGGSGSGTNVTGRPNALAKYSSSGIGVVDSALIQAVLAGGETNLSFFGSVILGTNGFTKLYDTATASTWDVPGQNWVWKNSTGSGTNTMVLSPQGFLTVPTVVSANLVAADGITLRGAKITSWPTNTGSSSQIILDEVNPAPGATRPQLTSSAAIWQNPLLGKVYSWSVQGQVWIPISL